MKHYMMNGTLEVMTVINNNNQKKIEENDEDDGVYIYYLFANLMKL